jgi:putative addiction module component (TIGR02574 family)
MNTLLEQALRLPVAERRKLADEIYDSIEAEDQHLHLTDEQKAELERRMEDYEKDPGGNLSWEEVRDAALARR